jgi:hypothetical protein
MLATTMKNSLPTKISKKPIDIVGNAPAKQLNVQTTKTPIHPDRRNLPLGACLPAGGKTSSCLGVCSGA